MTMADSVGQYGKFQGTVPVAAGPDVMLQFQDSTYVAGASAAAAAATGKMAGPSEPTKGGSGDPSFSSGPPGNGSAVGGGGPYHATDGPRWGCFSLSFYKPYFDVDTSDVIERIRDSLTPYTRSSFLEKTSLNPDMYGPFWICTTLVVAVAALGNLSSYLTFETSVDESGQTVTWHYDINDVYSAAAILYGYAALVPAGLAFTLKCLKVPVGLVQLWCLYGYSLFIFIPTSVLTIIPLEWLRWILVLAATGMSTTFLGSTLKSQIQSLEEHWLVIVSVCCGLHVCLGLVLKIYFFTFFSGTDSINLN
eukprot:TRINITY_DN4207_c1_g2_i1.p1 TRINITY_DN4207_c1_g2~~TRINITY_DN4207_c1_g2_i1.p1  ORF type:complete len:307 (+),score=83.22 TRINITY_DN4207_c1_g2_i1:236-1156(+)